MIVMTYHEFHKLLFLSFFLILPMNSILIFIKVYRNCLLKSSIYFLIRISSLLCLEERLCLNHLYLKGDRRLPNPAVKEAIKVATVKGISLKRD